MRILCWCQGAVSADRRPDRGFGRSKGDGTILRCGAERKLRERNRKMLSEFHNEIVQKLSEMIEEYRIQTGYNPCGIVAGSAVYRELLRDTDTTETEECYLWRGIALKRKSGIGNSVFLVGKPYPKVSSEESGSTLSNTEFAAIMREEAEKWDSAEIMVTTELWLQIADRVEASSDPKGTEPYKEIKL